MRVERRALGGDVGPAIEARERDGGVVLGELRVGAGRDRRADRPVARAVEVDAEVREPPDRMRESRVTGDDESAFSRGERLGRNVQAPLTEFTMKRRKRTLRRENSVAMLSTA